MVTAITAILAIILKIEGAKPYKQWVIVIFMETNDYSVIPVNWLISQTEVTILNILSVQYCRWPSFNVTNDELLRAGDPGDLWNSFKIKTLDANFKEACDKRIELENFIIKAQKQKNNKRRKSSSDSDFQVIYYTHRQKNIKYVKKAVKFSEFSVTLPPTIQIEASTSGISDVHENMYDYLDQNYSIKINIPLNYDNNSEIYYLKEKNMKKKNKTIKPNYCINPPVNTYDDLKLTNFNTFNSVVENDIPNNLCLTEKLRLLFIKYNMSYNICNSLIQVLKNENLNVPKDIWTLFKTPKFNDIVDISGGSYIYLGLKNMLLPILVKNIGINIDGLTLSKSAKHLKRNVVLDNGINVNGFFFTINISNITYDSLAKAFILNVKGDNEYFGCTLCTEEGTYLKHRMTYPGLDAPLRTDETFRNKRDKYYHKGYSPLVRLPINIINTVVLDYMHNVCLGVVKQLIGFWVKGIKGNKQVQLEKNKKNKINYELKIIRPYIPSEIGHLLRAIDEIEYYKFTELRTFLLYTGQIVLKGNLKKKFYFHFLLLVYAIRILICAKTCLKYNKLATQFLKKFVNDYSSLYGSQFISYNVHSLVHLPTYVLIHGPLDNFSCFRYDNFLQEIIKSMKSIKYPLQEIFNIISQKQKIYGKKYRSQLHYTFSVLSNEIIHKNSSPFFKVNDKLFGTKHLTLTNTVINVFKEKDRYIMLTNNNIVMVQHIVQPRNKLSTHNLIIKRFLNCYEFGVTPLSSIEIGVYVVDTTKMSELYCINLTDIKYKCFFIGLTENLALISDFNIYGTSCCSRDPTKIC
ncbi:hypothetical protein AGLY_016210 [Aphis glycines]|uniref:Uncharacterized protein n=1 Tax=Aphis glycines TaxID=307491 RepID=A0A6G0SZT1_APHGL|nr:hypothetical protein AGLY_016210 [Aphis glycines]